MAHIEGVFSAFIMRIVRNIFFAALLFAVLARSANAASDLYSVKPMWWDNAPLNLPPVAQLADPDKAWTAMEAIISPWQRPLDDWWIAGPFDGGKGLGMDIDQPPEVQFSLVAVMVGKGGLKVPWREWKQGHSKPPLPPALSDAIVFAYKAIHADANIRGWLVVKGSGRMKVWVDGQLRVADSWPGDYCSIFCDWQSGAHQVLIKLDAASGGWNYQVAWQQVRPEESEIRCRTEIVHRWPDRALVVEQQGLRIAALYAHLNDTVNFRYWASRVMAQEKDATHMGVVANALGGIVDRRPDLAAVLNATVCDMLPSVQTNAALRDVYVGLLLRCTTADDFETNMRTIRQTGYQPSATQTEQFMAACSAPNRAGTFAYWLNQYLQSETSTGHLAQVLNAQLAQASDSGRAVVYDAIEQVLASGAQTNLYETLARTYATAALAHSDGRHLDQLLTCGDGVVRKILPFDSFLWDAHAACLGRDQDRARGALAQIAMIRPAYVNNPEYKTLSSTMFLMRMNESRPGAVLEDTDDIVQNITRFSGQNDNTRLFGYIRGTLTGRGHYMMVNTNDMNLFVGAKSVYRQLFAPYSAGYTTFLTNEVAGLSLRPGLADEAEQLRCVASLTPVTSLAGRLPGVASRTVASCPTVCGGFSGLVEVPPGMLEMRGDETRNSEFRAWQPVLSGAGADLDGLLVAQTTRAIVALSHGSVIWSHLMPLRPEPLGHGQPAQPPGKIFGGVCRPARVGDVIAARLEIVPGQFALFGFDARSGTMRWHWRGGDGDEPAGSPASWRGNRFVVPLLHSDGVDTAVALAVVDASTGVEQFRLALASTASPNIPSAGLAHYRMLGAPAIVGDAAYVDTGLGLVSAVDLQDKSVRWSRLYQRSFNPFGGGMRLSITPIVGSRNVCFVPVDSMNVILVDRLTGALVGRRSNVDWTSAGPCGSDMAVVTTPLGVRLIALSGVESEDKTIGSLSHMLYLAPLADGCVLGGDGQLMTMNARGASVHVDRTPANVIPACQDSDGRWWGWSGIMYSTWGRLDDGASHKVARLVEPPLLSSVQMAGLCARSHPYGPNPDTFVFPATDGMFLASPGVLTRVGSDGSPRWSIPYSFSSLRLPKRQIGEKDLDWLHWDPAFPPALVQQAGHRVAALSRGRLWMLDDTDGSVLSIWPSLMSGSLGGNIIAISACGGVVYVAQPIAGHIRISSLGMEGRDSPAALVELPLNNTGCGSFWVLVAGGHIWVVTSNTENNDVHVYHASYTGGGTPATATLFKQWGGSGNAAVWLDHTRRDLVILSRTPPETVSFGADGMMRHEMNGLTELWSGVGGCWHWGDMLVGRVKEGIMRVVEPVTGNTMTLGDHGDNSNASSLGWCGPVGATVCGLNHAASTFFQRDLAHSSDADDQEQTLTSDTPIGANVQWRGAVPARDHDVAFLTSYSLPGAVRPEMLLKAYIWTHGSKTVTQSLIPAALKPPHPVAPNLWRFGDFFLSDSDWETCLSLNKLVRSIPETENYRAFGDVAMNGFLDEWQNNEFVDIPQGRIAIRRNGQSDSYRIAIDLKSPAAASAVALANDLPSVAWLWLSRGEQANFDAATWSFKRMTDLMGDGQPVKKCVWQVSPDARHATLEIECTIEHNKPNKTESASVVRDTFGDVALSLYVSDPVLGDVPLIGTGRPGPIGFVRLRLP